MIDRRVVAHPDHEMPERDIHGAQRLKPTQPTQQVQHPTTIPEDPMVLMVHVRGPSRRQAER